ncbi:MAG: DUF2267 domain-containing protein [Kofleriaceae bacterium]
MTRSQLFDPAVESARKWLVELAENLDLPSAEDPRTMRSLRAGLHAIRARLTLHEVIDLGAQLPVLIRGIYYEGLASNHDPTSIRTPSQMLQRVSDELGNEHRVEAVDVLRGVIHLLVEHVSTGEIRDIVATLPAPIAMMWRDLTGHALVELEPR